MPDGSVVRMSVCHDLVESHVGCMVVLTVRLEPNIFGLSYITIAISASIMTYFKTFSHMNYNWRTPYS